jgi:hypothetical protein
MTEAQAVSLRWIVGNNQCSILIAQVGFKTESALKGADKSNLTVFFFGPQPETAVAQDLH